MDIQIVDVQVKGNSIITHRMIDGRLNVEKAPKEALAIRAAEYDLEMDDPRAMDILLLERFYRPEDPDEVHPLYISDTIEDALEIVLDRVEQVKNDNGAPKEMPMRSLFHAADSDESTQGLTDLKAKLLEYRDPEFARWIQINRDAGRKGYRGKPKSLADKVKATAIGYLQAEANEINQARILGAR